MLARFVELSCTLNRKVVSVAATKVKPTTPAGLSKSGAAFWRSTTAKYVLRVDELVVLEAASRTLDILARLDEALSDAPLMVRGGQGQERENPLISEARQQRGVLARLVRQLALPDDATRTDAAAVARTEHARNAAQIRWGNR
jgi:hypothetical protein